MAEIIQLDAIVHFPLLTVLKSGDGFNKARGSFFYFDRDARYHGPFMSRLTAQLDLMHQSCDSAVPMRTAFEQDAVWWWKKDSPDGPAIAGPYETEIEAQRAIYSHALALKNRAS